MSALRVACVIPTYNGCRDLARLLDSLAIQSAVFDTLIVDSSSSDGTYELAVSRCPNVLRIDSRDFNHGGTRQLMVERSADYDVYVFMTQDAYLADAEGIARIVAPFADGQVGAVCGRQLPHLDASPLATHARLFNYPPTSQVKSLADVPALGIKTAFMSNSFSAYRREALMQVGGFPNHVILSEDMYVGARCSWPAGRSSMKAQPVATTPTTTASGKSFAAISTSGCSTPGSPGSARPSAAPAAKDCATSNPSWRSSVSDGCCNGQAHCCAMH
ncbi:glycosyltransferase family 2 protein [Pseudomonas piscis]|uniref:glycosyltransferase family 2 protein n=1 Tax=Pseudomonas piscis TaxID=2614538 RepID=UPI0003B67F52|nr:glycosyltransferase family 2 protein [Pseudomonas piscis]ERO64809.1 hypothetical protein P308_22305 [Pseudomonas piscis]